MLHCFCSLLRCSPRGIVYDAEFVKLRAQNAREWAAEDAALRDKLAAMRKKYGRPPNIIHIMWDDNSLGEVGIPQMNKELGKVGYRTAFVGKAHQGDIEQSYMNYQGFNYANFSMYNQFPLINWHEFLGPSGAVQGLFESQWDRNYTVHREFRPLGYVNQLEGRKGEKPRVFTGTSLPEYKQLMRQHQQLVIDYLDDAEGGDKPFYLAYWPPRSKNSSSEPGWEIAPA